MALVPFLLESDHVNYLIWRYLQERGMARTAVSLQREWNTPNPEALSFSHAVKSHELIRLIQDGAHYDELATAAYDREAAARDTDASVALPKPRRYQFLRLPYERKRPTSLSADQGDDAGSVSAHDEERARKRQRVEANGVRKSAAPVPARRKPSGPTSVPRDSAEDPMEIDDRNLDAPEEPEAIVEEFRSPTPPTTLQLGLSSGVNTDPVLVAPQAKTLHNFLIEDVDITQTNWDTVDASQLHIAGGSIWKTYHVTDEAVLNPVSPPISTDHTAAKDPYYVSAVSQHPSTGRLAYAMTEYSGIGQNCVQYVTKSSATGVQSKRVLSQDTDNTLFLRWSRDGSKLLGSSHTLEGFGHVNVWTVDETDECAIARFPLPLFDGIWIADSKFVLSGKQELGVYELKDGFVNLLHQVETKLDWDMIRFDVMTSKVACLDCDHGYLGVLDVDTQRFEEVKAHDECVTTFDYQPGTATEAGQTAPKRLIVTGDVDRTAKLWDPETLQCVKTYTMQPSMPVMAIAFAPDASKIAFAGDRRIEIWSAGLDGTRIARWDDCEEDLDEVVKINDQVTAPWHALSWDVDSSKLAYTQGRRVSFAHKYVRRPSLTPD